VATAVGRRPLSPPLPHAPRAPLSPSPDVAQCGWVPDVSWPAQGQKHGFVAARPHLRVSSQFAHVPFFAVLSLACLSQLRWHKYINLGHSFILLSDARIYRTNFILAQDFY